MAGRQGGRKAKEDGVVLEGYSAKGIKAGELGKVALQPWQSLLCPPPGVPQDSVEMAHALLR